MNKTKLIKNYSHSANYRSMPLYDACCSSTNQEKKKKEASSPNYRSITFDTSSMTTNKLKNLKNMAANSIIRGHQSDNDNNSWTIFPWQVQSIPKLYPLESSHRMIHDVEFKDIIQNLVQCFQKLNLRATYKNDKRPTTRAILKLKQNNNLDIEEVQMNLYLWKIENNTICIELQRRQATNDEYRIIFHRYAKLILEAATTSTSHDNESDNEKDCQIPSNRERKQSFGIAKMNRSYLRNECYSATNMNTNQRIHHHHEQEQQEQREITSSISLVKSLLLQQSNSTDTQLLGMKSLCILTDAKKTSIAISYFLSCAIIFGSNIMVNNLNENNATADSLHNVIMKMMIGDNNKNDDSIIDEMEYYDSDDDEYYDSDDDEYEEDSFFTESKRQDSSGIKQTLKRLGLTVFSNSLETLYNLMCILNDNNDEVNTEAHHHLKRNSINHSKNKNITLYDDDNFLITTELIINNLLKELTAAATVEKYLALKCLRLFCQLSFFFENQQQRAFVGKYLKQKSGILLKIVSENSHNSRERGGSSGCQTTPQQEECKRLAEVLEVLLDDDSEQ